MWIYRTNHRRIENCPVFILFIVFLLLDPVLSPDFALDTGSNRNTSTDAVIFAAEAKTKETSRKHLGTTKTIPSYSSPHYSL